MRAQRVEEWQWDDENLRELARHGVQRRQVEQIWRGSPRFRRNRRRRAASHQMIGPTGGGTMLVVCIVEVAGQPGLWRAITGWPADAPELDWYRRSR
ncbi:hypothetical protein BH24ACT26_BH24ACT26_02100 [soil metagenome]